MQNNLLKNDIITSFGVLFWIFMFHIVYLRHVIVCPILEVILFSFLWESFAFCIDSCDFFFFSPSFCTCESFVIELLVQKSVVLYFISHYFFMYMKEKRGKKSEFI